MNQLLTAFVKTALMKNYPDADCRQNRRTAVNFLQNIEQPP